MFGFEAYHVRACHSSFSGREFTDSYQGNGALAQKQILCGLSFIAEWQSSHSYLERQTTQSGMPEVWPGGHDLCQFFGRLELQLGLPGRLDTFSHNLPIYDGEYVLVDMPSCFHDLNVAQGFLHLLMKRLQYLLQVIKSLSILPTSNLCHPDQASTAVEKRSALERMHEIQVEDNRRWQIAFTSLLQKIPMNQSTSLMITCIKLHYETTNMVLDTLLSDAMIYDTHAMLIRFENIIDLAAEHISLVKKRSYTSKFNFDLGSILPLYLVALRCRTRSTRDRAISMLLNLPRREGVWDSVYAGRFACWLGNQEDRERDEKGVVPLWARVTGAFSKFDLQERRAHVSCLQLKRTHQHGFVEVKRQAIIVW